MPRPYNPVTSSIAAYSVQKETTAFVAALTSKPSDIRLQTIDTCIKRLKRSGAWKKIRLLNLIGKTEEASLTDWKDPSKRLTKIGTPQFESDIGWSAVSPGQAIDSGVSPADLSVDSLFHAVWCQGVDDAGSTAKSSFMDYGCVGTDGNGISICVRTKQDQVIARTQGASITAVTAGMSDGYGLTGAQRDQEASSCGVRNGIWYSRGDDKVAPPASGTITFLAATVGGKLTNNHSRNTQAGWIIADALTEAEARAVTGAISTYLDAVRYGEINENSAGIGPKNVEADVICYGTTAQSVCAALQAARAGMRVVIVGGWRDRHVGGMSASGLGETDFFAPDYMQGLPRYAIMQARALSGYGEKGIPFHTRMFGRIMRRLLDRNRNGGYDIPVFYSKGVSSVEKGGINITSLTTVDGRKVAGKQFIDGSYEGDLMLVAGMPYRIGREAAGEAMERMGGYRGTALNGYSGHKQFLNARKTHVWVDPWKVPNDPTSGPLNGVRGVSSQFSPELHDQPKFGAADDELQAYCFRLAFSNDPKRNVPMPDRPPAGWNADDYEMLFRFLEKAPDVQMKDRFRLNKLGDGAFDLNTGHGMGTDYVFGSKEYPLASYERREKIWKETWNYTLGLFYALQHHSDPRVPTLLRTQARRWGPLMDHYHNPHENDVVFDTPQLYVRESVRMIGAATADANMLNQTDNETPILGKKTISVASYAFDHHVMTRMALEHAPGEWGIWMEGGWILKQGNDNRMNPIPLEICVPAAKDCGNLSVTFAASLTTVAFGSFRMEITAMQAGQTIGQLAAQAIKDGTSIQEVDYDAAIASILAENSPRLSGETPPSLPGYT